MWKENPLWGEDVIAGELAKLGHHVSPRTVAKYRPANLPRSRGQKWSTFIRNHLVQTWAADWFTIVTLRFQVLYAFVILDLGRREVVRLGVTTAPSAEYAAQSFVEAVCDRDDQAPRFLVRDRDSIYGIEFRRRVKGFGTRCLVTPPRAPTAKGYASYCTSWGLFAGTLSKRRRFSSLRPRSFFGGWLPGSSYRHSGLSL
jgi:hypothetical protein